MGEIECGLAGVHIAIEGEDEEKAAALCRVLRLESMVAARGAIEEQEAICPPSAWSLAR